MPRFDPVIGHQPRFALTTPRFRFRALAACAGRASLGGDREIAMACLVGGRLASALLPPYTITAADTKARSTAAKHWLASLSLPAPVRSALTHLVDAVAAGNRKTAAGALSHLVMVAQRSIDEASAGELVAVAVSLEADI